MSASTITYADRTDSTTPSGGTDEWSSVHCNSIKSVVNNHAGLIDALSTGLHADNATVNPATAGAPTPVEIKAFNDAQGTPQVGLIYYTGDDTATPANATYVFFADESGAVMPVMSPAAGVSYADAISPAADDAVGAVGVIDEAAREDHKHPAQGVSADANQLLKAGSDGLHMLEMSDLADMVGDAGAGGVAGLVPAPAAGDAAANKYLKADGTWVTVPGGVTVNDGLADAAALAAVTGMVEGDLAQVLDADGNGREAWYTYDGAAWDRMHHEIYYHGAIADLVALSGISTQLDGDTVFIVDADGDGNGAFYTYYAANGLWGAHSARVDRVYTAANAAALAALAGMRQSDLAVVTDSDGNGREAWYSYDGAAWDRMSFVAVDHGAQADAATRDALTGVEDGDKCTVTDEGGARYMYVAGAWELLDARLEFAPAFVGSYDYKAGEVILQDGVFLSRNADGTSAATWTALESGNWTYVAQQGLPSWTATQVYVAGTRVTVSNQELVANTNFTAQSAFNAGEVARWDLVSQRGLNAWSANTGYVEGARVVYNGVEWYKHTAGMSDATFNTANWSRYRQLEILDWAADTYYLTDEQAYNGNNLLRRKNVGISEASWNLAEAGDWELVSQQDVGAWAATTVVMAGEMVTGAHPDDATRQLLLQSNAARTTGAALDSTELGFWTILADSAGEDNIKLIQQLMAPGFTPASGTGTRSLEDSHFGDGKVVRLADADAAAATAFEVALGSLAFAAADTYQIRLDVLEDTAQVNHVLEIGYADAGGNSAVELIEIGNGGAAVVVGGADAGNVVGTATVTEFDRGDRRLYRIDMVLSWAGASGATPVLSIKPAYNLDGTAVEDAAAQASVDLLDLQMGAVAEFQVGQQEVIQARVDSSGGASVLTLPAATGTGQAQLITAADVQSNQATAAVQAGESLNGVTDGVFYFSSFSDGTQFIATDVATGQWTVSVVGASASGPGPTVVTGAAAAATINQISGPTMTVSSSTTPGGGAILLNSLDTLTYYVEDNGVRHYRLTFYIDNDSPWEIEVDGAIDIAGVQAVGYSAGSGDFANRMVFSYRSSANAIVLDRDNDSNVDMRVEVTFTAFMEPSSVVLAGMVEPTALRNGISTLASDHDVADAGGITSFEDTTLTVTVPGAGRWKLEAVLHGFIGNGADDGQGINGVIADSSNTVVNDGGSTRIVGDSDSVVANSTVEKRGMARLVGYVDTVASETFKVRVSQITNTPANILSAGSTLRYEEMPVSTVVMPDAIVPEVMSFGTVYLDAGSGTVTTCPLDAVAPDSSGLTATGSGFTVATAGRYHLMPHASLIGVTQDIELKVNGVVRYTFNDDGNNTKGNGVTVNLGVGDVVSLETSVAAQWANENVGSLAQDSNASRVVVLPSAQYNVIEPSALAADDQTASGYMDLGGMRMQWGTNSEGTAALRTVTFPVAMANANYSVVCTAINNAADQIVAVVDSKTTTGFQVRVLDDVGLVTVDFDWQVMGAK